MDCRSSGGDVKFAVDHRLEALHGEGGDEGEGGEGGEGREGRRGEELIFMHLRVDPGTLRALIHQPCHLSRRLFWKCCFAGSVEGVLDVPQRQLHIPARHVGTARVSGGIRWPPLPGVLPDREDLWNSIEVDEKIATAVRDQPRLCCGVWEHLVECEPHTTWPWTLASLMLQKKQAEADWRQTRDGTEPVSWNRFRALTSRAAAAETTAVEAQQKPQPQAHSRCESQK